MKKLALSVVAVSSLLGSSCALADNHTLSLGYAQAKVQDFKNIRGLNMQYRYEWDSPVSIVGAATYMKGDEDYSDYGYDSGYNGKTELKYYSLLVGPAYRINDYVSFYAVAGLAHTKAEDRTTYLTQYTEETSQSKTSFAYGAGVQFNPLENMSVGIGYEGTRAKYGDNVSINGFNVTLGYRF